MKILLYMIMIIFHHNINPVKSQIVRCSDADSEAAVPLIMPHFKALRRFFWRLITEILRRSFSCP
jgi:hypothetical protein